MIKSVFASLALLALLTANSMAGFVLLDSFGTQQNFNAAPTVVGAGSGLFAGATRTFSNAAQTRTTSGGLLQVIGDTTITYSKAGGLGVTLSQLSPTGGNGLFSFTSVADAGNTGATSSIVITRSDDVVFNFSSRQPGGSMFEFDFSQAGLTDTLTLKQVAFTFTGLTDGFTADSLAATPEPASMLTAGVFSLLGAAVYRRRKAKKETETV